MIPASTSSGCDEELSPGVNDYQDGAHQCAGSFTRRPLDIERDARFWDGCR
jgi:hypothetical protein